MSAKANSFGPSKLWPSLVVNAAILISGIVRSEPPRHTFVSAAGHIGQNPAVWKFQRVADQDCLPLGQACGGWIDASGCIIQCIAQVAVDLDIADIAPSLSVMAWL